MAARANPVPNLMPNWHSKYHAKEKYSFFYFFYLQIPICIVESKHKKERKKMKNTKIIMNREELNKVLYENPVELDTLVGTEYAIGGELLDEARNNRNFIEYFFPSGDEGEFIEVDNDGYVINDGIYR